MEQIRSLSQLLEYAKKIGAEKGPKKLSVAMAEEAGLLSAIEEARQAGFAQAILVGNADMLLVPDIESGNFVGKVLLYMTGGKGAGVILGARKPIVLTSRFDSMETKLLSIALGAVVARS